jgi:hypothetical protein
LRRQGGPHQHRCIGAALKVLQGPPTGGPNINVSGACSENVVIKSLDRLTLNAVNGASIIDASNGFTDVVDVNNSTGVTLKGFSIIAVNQSNDAVNCSNGAGCTLISNPLQGGFGRLRLCHYARLRVSEP